jgi:hypothetical protein
MKPPSNDFLAYSPCFEKIKVGLRDHLVVCVCMYVYMIIPLIN